MDDLDLYRTPWLLVKTHGEFRWRTARDGVGGRGHEVSASLVEDTRRITLETVGVGGG